MHIRKQKMGNKEYQMTLRLLQIFEIYAEKYFANMEIIMIFVVNSIELLQ